MTLVLKVEIPLKYLNQYSSCLGQRLPLEGRLDLSNVKDHEKVMLDFLCRSEYNSLR